MQTTRFLPESGSYPVGGELAFDADTLRRRRVDAHWVAHADGVTLARVSLWCQRASASPGERLGILGHYAASDPGSGLAVLRRACAELAVAGCTLAVGPMDGDTWHPYRFVTDRGDAPPFFLEPWQPPDWPRHWTDAGFGTWAEYFSTVRDHVSTATDDPRQQEAVRRVRSAGVSVRALDATRWQEELRRVHAVASISFQENFLYRPLAVEDFLALYAPLERIVRPELVLIAEDADGQPVGFALGLPDVLDAKRETLIIKTVAVLPAVAGIGLGRVLTDELHRAGHALGFRRTIHALMHDDNVSRHLSARFGSRPLRRYALFSRRLP